MTLRYLKSLLSISITYSLYLKRLVRQIADDTKLLVGGHCSPYSLLYLLSEVRAVYELSSDTPEVNHIHQKVNLSQSFTTH
jgi:hypothetical protein